MPDIYARWQVRSFIGQVGRQPFRRPSAHQPTSPPARRNSQACLPQCDTEAVDHLRPPSRAARLSRRRRRLREERRAESLNQSCVALVCGTRSEAAAPPQRVLVKTGPKQSEAMMIVIIIAAAASRDGTRSLALRTPLVVVKLEPSAIENDRVGRTSIDLVDTRPTFTN